MTKKQRILSVLTKPQLVDLARHFELDVRQTQSVGEILERVSASKRASLDRILASFSRDQLKDACERLGLPRDGREKQVLVDRLLDAANGRNGEGDGPGCAYPTLEAARAAAASEDSAAAYEHKAATALARPDVGTQPQFRKRREAKTYRYDSSLSPALD
jgi:hypothetical protein